MPFVQAAPIGHTRPHIPQFLMLPRRLVSHPSAWSLLQFANPGLQTTPQVLFMQTGVMLTTGGGGAVHGVPHLRQWFTLERRSVSHPFAGFESQSSKFGRHA